MKDFFYTTKNIAPRMSINEICREFRSRPDVVLVWNINTKETKVFAIKDLVKTLTKEPKSKYWFYDVQDNALHTEFDIKHMLRQAKRNEQIRLYQTIICDGEVIR